MKCEITVRAGRPGPVIHRDIYGHFAEHLGRCIYEGLWVGPRSSIPNTRGIRNDVVAALKKLRVPVLRWPGGCFADEYHWRDGIGPRTRRPRMVNTHWGGVVENNHFGTHEFLDLCGQVGCEPYICGNVGSGTVHEMQQWVEYMTFDGVSPMSDLRAKNGRKAPWKLTYFGVGNENWGCGGNMTPEYYADAYRRYATYVRNFGGNQVYKIACGANSFDYRWTEVLMANAGRFMDGLSLHYYTVPSGQWGAKGAATGFDEAAWQKTLKQTLFMDRLITKHAAIMDQHDPERRVGMIVDEWGTWYDVEPGTNPGFLYQQNTLRDALVAALNFHVFHKHAARVRMANIAQTVNVLQAMVLTDKKKMVLTPTYYVFEMYKVFQDATSLPLTVETPDYTYRRRRLPAVQATAARNASGRVFVGLVNTHPSRAATVSLTVTGAPGKTVSGHVLTAEQMDAHNTFSAPGAVKPRRLKDIALKGRKLSVKLPPKSVARLKIST